MRSVTKGLLNHGEEIHRLLITMLKKLKMSKKDERTVVGEAVGDLFWLSRIMQYSPIKYGVFPGLNEEEAKLIYFLDLDKNQIVLHDVYVSPKHRKQGIAKALIVEALADNRDIPVVTFHTRESNKPVHNLVAFFCKKFQIPSGFIVTQIVPDFYVDGGKAIWYSVPNPAFEMTAHSEPVSPSIEPEVISAEA